MANKLDFQVNDLRSRLERMGAILNEMDPLDASYIRYLEQEAMIKELEAQVQHLMGDVNHKPIGQQQAMQERIKGLEAELASHKRNPKEVIKENVKLSEKKSEITRQWKRDLSDYSECIKERDKLKDENAELKKQLDKNLYLGEAGELKYYYDKVCAENDGLKRDCSTLTEQVEKHKADAEFFESENERLKGEANALNKTVVELLKGREK